MTRDDRHYKIYTLSSNKTGEIRYVGVTSCSLNQRFYQHTWNAKHKLNISLSRWIVSNDFDISIEIVDEVYENWEFSEQYWISQFKSWGFDLLNKDKGGRGLIKGRRLLSEEKKTKPVWQYTMDGNFIQEHPSIKAATQALALKSLSSLTNHLVKGHGRHVAGFRWSYKGEKPKPYRRIIVTIEGRQEIYPDLMAASKQYSFCRTTMRNFLEGKRNRSRYDIDVKYDFV